MKRFVAPFLVLAFLFSTLLEVEAATTFGIEGANDTWTFTETETAGFSTVSLTNGGTGLLRVFERSGRLGIAEICDTNENNCVTPGALAGVVAGTAFADGIDESTLETYDDAGVTKIRVRAEGVTTNELANGTIEMADIFSGIYETSTLDPGVDGDDLVTEQAVTNYVTTYVPSYVSTNGDGMGDHIASANVDLGDSSTGTLGTDYFKIVGGGTKGMRLTNQGTAYFDDTVYASSDRRLKRNIRPIGTSLGKLRQLRPVSFEWKDLEQDQGTQLGFVAQEVQLIYPEVVRTNGQYLSVSYTALVPALVASVQELDGRVKELEQRIAGLTD